jgi:site-specific DNA-methyltransferase (adenine-specific)
MDNITDLDPSLDSILGQPRSDVWANYDAANASVLTEAPLLNIGQPFYTLPGPASAELYQGDCRNLLTEMPSESINTVLTDPPFNIGLDYGKHYHDCKSSEQFLGMLEGAMREVYRIIKQNGALCVFMGPHYQAELLVRLKLIGFHHRNTIIWHNTFGQCQTRKFTPSWTAIHYVVKSDKGFTFNADAIRVPSARQLLYGDKRAYIKGKVPDDTWVLLPELQAPECFSPDSDLWLESRVCGTFKENAGHITQLPLPIVERLIQATTNPGDLVLDPFAGTGTTLVAARRLGRRSIGIELSADTAAIASKRLADQLAAETSPATTPVGDQS